ncbi:hypothetical protein GW17_00021850 [Ensete ventricosum]|nr:hypothetical protein GW17_00021850 [Ensete ventricosum]
MRCAHFVVKEPMVIGHECAGVIEEVGSEVKSLVVGDRVALEPGISCGHCKYCKGGRYNLCRSMRFFGSPPVNGSLANQVIKHRFYPKYYICAKIRRSCNADSNLEDVVDEEVIQIQQAMGSDIDVSFDCAGFNKTVSTALNATCAGGIVCLIGMGHNEMTVHLTPAAARYNLMHD